MSVDEASLGGLQAQVANKTKVGSMVLTLSGAAELDKKVLDIMIHSLRSNNMYKSTYTH